jgi:hypothetical protein
MIPVGTIHYCTIEGARLNEEVCERCGRRFIYQLHRTATGECVNLLWLDSKGATEEAASEAVGLLKNRLAREFDVVSCPSCGHIQRKMVRLLWKYSAKLFGAVLFFVSLPSLALLAYSVDGFILFKGQLRIAFLLFIGSLLVATAGAVLLWRNPKLIYRLFVRERANRRPIVGALR